MRQGDVAIVTGAASGIGAELARNLAARGVRLSLVDRDENRLAAVSAELAAGGAAVRTFAVDVRDCDAVEALVHETHRINGQIDYMFNNAGITLLGEARDLQLEDWREIIDTDLMGVVHGVTSCYPILVRQRRGHIVNIASLNAVVPVPGAVAYVAAKHGVLGLSLALRFEAALVGVRVSAVCPALVATRIFETTRTVGIDLVRARELLPGTPMPAERCARIILRGVRRNRAVIYPGLAGPVAWLHRHLPAATTMLGNSLARRFLALKEG